MKRFAYHASVARPSWNSATLLPAPVMWLAMSARASSQLTLAKPPLPSAFMGSVTRSSEVVSEGRPWPRPHIYPPECGWPSAPIKRHSFPPRTQASMPHLFAQPAHSVALVYVTEASELRGSVCEEEQPVEVPIAANAAQLAPAARNPRLVIMLSMMCPFSSKSNWSRG